VNILIIFSGLPEDGDEAFDLLLAKMMGWNQDLGQCAVITHRDDETETHNKLAWDLLVPPVT